MLPEKTVHSRTALLRAGCPGVGQMVLHEVAYLRVSHVLEFTHTESPTINKSLTRSHAQVLRFNLASCF